MKAVIFSCQGLGDGLISLTLANNLKLNGYECITFHNQLLEMQEWFKDLEVNKLPSEDKFLSILQNSDLIFVSFDSSEYFQKLIRLGKEKFYKKFFVLNPSFSPKIGKQKFYEDALFDPNICMVDNIELFCIRVLRFLHTSKTCGIHPINNLSHRKYLNRIIVHPTSANIAKNWSMQKYVKLALQLSKKGFSPVMVVGKREEALLKDLPVEIKAFSNLNDLAAFVYESGYMIGNDSGIGHLASSLKIPTISIFRNFRSAKLWRPGFGNGKIIYPNKMIPNLAFYRLRDKHWRKFITVKNVLKVFEKIF
ncbi:MAG: hypothetical protein HZB76_04300 [Chlamydiae bacterium]|nr:hypothetical protein [Chlamydiota bacterium]